MKKLIFSYLLMLANVCMMNAQEYVCNTEQIHVAVIMPFDLDNNAKSIESKKALDFYKGILLTVDSMKHAGVNIDVLALDEGYGDNSKITSVIQHPFLKEADVIIGPGRNANISPLTTFAQLNHVPLVVPFTNTPGLPEGKPYVFQCNTKHAAHYTKVFNRFVKMHSNENILFVNMNDSHSGPFTAEFTNHLAENSIPYHHVDYS